MAEYIEREEAYSLAKKVCEAVDSNPRVLLPMIILDLVDDLPAADVRPAARGEWGKSLNSNFSPFDNSGEYLYRCNQCRHIQNYESNFCPNCGADMREES